MYDSYQGSMPFYNSLLQLAVSHEVVSMCTFSECSCHCTNSLIIAVQWCRTVVHDQTNILFPLQQKYKGSMPRSYEDFSSACAFVDAVDISQDTPHDLDCQTRILVHTDHDTLLKQSLFWHIDPLYFLARHHIFSLFDTLPKSADICSW